MAYTQLSVTATPGRRHSFSAKTPIAGTHTGLFTELSVTATPGRIHSFSPKTAASGEGAHEGLFTELSVVALPGGRHVFLPKAVAEPVPVPPSARAVGGGSGGGYTVSWYEHERKHEITSNDEKDIQEMLTMILSSGILN
jgi:hypothetical protein